jgi:hypothetical protein
MSEYDRDELSEFLKREAELIPVASQMASVDRLAATGSASVAPRFHDHWPTVLLVKKLHKKFSSSLHAPIHVVCLG